MPETKEIDVMESVYDKNELVAKKTNEKLTKKGIFAVNVMGSPGAGKTSSLKRITEKIGDVTPYVIEGDIESDIDTKALNSLGIQTIQINTGGACHLDSPLIENIGNLVCPAEFEIGEHVKMLISTTTEGSDKPYKYPLAFEKADIILINKCDLIPYVDFDEEYFMKGVRALNPTAPVFRVSAKNDEGYEEVVSWIKNRLK